MAYGYAYAMQLPALYACWARFGISVEGVLTLEIHTRHNSSCESSTSAKGVADSVLGEAVEAEVIPRLAGHLA